MESLSQESGKDPPNSKLLLLFSAALFRNSLLTLFSQSVKTAPFFKNFNTKTSKQFSIQLTAASGLLLKIVRSYTALINVP